MKVNRSRWLGYHWFSGEILIFPFENSRFSIWKFVVNVIVNNSMHVFFLFENLALTSKMINNVMLHKRWTDIWKKMFGICWTSVKCMVKRSESKRHYVTLMCVYVGGKSKTVFIHMWTLLFHNSLNSTEQCYKHGKQQCDTVEQRKLLL